MNIRFYNARILTETMDITEGELWVRGNTICYIGDGEDVSTVCKEPGDVILWDREIDVKRNLLMPGFKMRTHSAMTFLRSWQMTFHCRKNVLNEQVFPNEAKLKGEEAYLFAKIAIMEYLTSGITSAFDMYIYPKEVTRQACDCVFDRTGQVGLNNFTSSLEELEEQYVTYNDYHELCSYKLGFHAEYVKLDKKLLGGLGMIKKIPCTGIHP